MLHRIGAKLNHLDLYRLNGLDEIQDLGLDEYFLNNEVCAIEWAQKGSVILPADNLLINIDYLSEEKRKISFHPTGQCHDELVVGLINKLKIDKEVKWNFL